ncbi:MAG: CpsD/CapB family tyrosine-protein kinase [Acidobacteriia bacterium]|nr:CpsD/CapB family tyrosine-protein kinase [Terriglobia bacterium]
MRLRELKDLTKLQSLLITSPMPGDGKSTIALNLATALAERGKRSVLLIEADLYHPSLAEGLGLEERGGLAECLENQHDPMSLLRCLEPLGCYLLPAGKPVSNPTELLESESFSSVMRSLSPHFDWILIDTPPVIPLTDAVSLSRRVDGSLLVVRADRTPRDAIDQAVSLLGPKHVLGIVLNASDRLNKVYSKYYGYGHYDKK